MPRPLLPTLALLTLTLVACGQSTSTATHPVGDPATGASQASVTLRLPAPQSLSAQYINQSKTTRLDVQVDSDSVTPHTLGSAQAPCSNGICTVTLLNLSPGSHTFAFGTYGVKPSDSSTVLISQGNLTATLPAGQKSSFSLTLTPVGTSLFLSSAVKQYNATTKTFGNYIKFTTLAGRSLPAFYDIQGIDSVGDVIPSTAAISAVVCGDSGTAITDISDSAHPNRFRVEVQTLGSHTLSVHAGSTCAAGSMALASQTVSAVAPTAGSGMNRATIGAGYLHSMALLSDGTVRIWGGNDFGQLGNGTAAGSFVPVTVAGLSNVVGVVASISHTMALLNDGTVRSWGYNDAGQLGDGTRNNSRVPVTVTGLSNVVGISGGGNGSGGSSVALLADGTVRTWGQNNRGQLGNGTRIDSSVPVTVTGLNDVTDISGGYYGSIALLADGTVRTWGYNGQGQLGNGATTDSSVPVTVTGLKRVVGIAMGSQYSLAVLDDGTVKAWGDNTYGQLGNGSTTRSTTPVAVPNLNGVTSISAKYQYSLALLNDGTVRSWGNNIDGQLGNGTTTDSTGTVTATSDAVTGSASYTSVVGKANTTTSTVVLSPNTVKVNDRSTLTVTLKDGNGNPVTTAPTVAVSGDSSIGAATQQGNVFTYPVTGAAAPVTSSVNVQSGGNTVGTANLTVTPYALTVSDGTAALTSGSSQYDFRNAQSHTFTVAESNYPGAFTVTSSNTAVAAVAISGGALTVTPGSTAGFSTITVKDSAAFGQTFTFTVSVTTAVFNLN